MQQAGYVAVVDDDAAVRDSLALLLRAYGIDSHTYGSASDFLDSLRSDMPDCLVVDVNMPSISGLDLLRELSLLGVRIPSVVITGRDSEGTRDQCRVLGVTAYLVKPLDADALIGAINSALSTERGL
jgi:FixJ family two-component response regulator